MTEETQASDWLAVEQNRKAWRSAYQSRAVAERLLEPNQEAIRKARLALENVDEFVSPSMARSIQAEINLIREIGRDFGLVSEQSVRGALDLSGSDLLPKLFSVTYRGEELYPAFLFEKDPESPVRQKVRPFVAELAKLAEEYKWDAASVCYWFVTSTTWFPPGEAPVDYLDNPAKIITVFESAASVEW